MPYDSQNGTLSVIVPLYGQFDLKRTILSVKSVLSQENVDLEVIVSEQGESPKFPKTEGVKHVFKHHQPRHNLSDFNPGNVRNIGFLNSTGEYVYTNDADIIFPTKRYFSDVLKILGDSRGKVLFRPRMRRLPIEDFERFCSWVEDNGVVDATSMLNLRQEYVAKTDDSPRKLRVFEKNSIYMKTFTAFEKDFQEFLDGDNKGREPMFWNENRHCGGNLFTRAQFESVGGYCEDLMTWGCEDSDLQWKFAEKYGLDFFPDKMQVIHLDHPKGYFSPEMWARNEEIIAERKKLGVDFAIDLDRRNKVWTQ